MNIVYALKSYYTKFNHTIQHFYLLSSGLYKNINSEEWSDHMILFSNLVLGLNHIPFPRTTAKIIVLIIIVVGGYLYNWWQNRR
ncbi:hypothetical protein ABUE38_09870 [Pediococcus parvulus]|jgi:hypothetical protein|uniref:hypothetical protein n=1 Tax=Pediococcus parvulus TaxID=54062 RepID=UPI003D05DAD5